MNEKPVTLMADDAIRLGLTQLVEAMRTPALELELWHKDHDGKPFWAHLSAWIMSRPFLIDAVTRGYGKNGEEVMRFVRFCTEQLGAKPEMHVWNGVPCSVFQWPNGKQLGFRQAVVPGFEDEAITVDRWKQMTKAEIQELDPLIPLEEKAKTVCDVPACAREGTTMAECGHESIEEVIAKTDREMAEEIRDFKFEGKASEDTTSLDQAKANMESMLAGKAYGGDPVPSEPALCAVCDDEGVLYQGMPAVAIACHACSPCNADDATVDEDRARLEEWGESWLCGVCGEAMADEGVHDEDGSPIRRCKACVKAGRKPPPPPDEEDDQPDSAFGVVMFKEGRVVPFNGEVGFCCVCAFSIQDQELAWRRGNEDPTTIFWAHDECVYADLKKADLLTPQLEIDFATRREGRSPQRCKCGQTRTQHDGPGQSSTTGPCVRFRPSEDAEPLITEEMEEEDRKNRLREWLEKVNPDRVRVQRATKTWPTCFVCTKPVMKGMQWVAQWRGKDDKIKAKKRGHLDCYNGVKEELAHEPVEAA